MNTITQELLIEQSQNESEKPENISKWEIDFKYNGQEFKITSNGYQIEIVDKNGYEMGEITGNYVQVEETSEVIFQVSEVSNESVVDAEEGTPTFMHGHIPYLIAESITQIILSGKIDKWISSESTNSGSDKMYMHIDEEGRVNVQTKQSSETFHFHYEITRKK